MMKTEEVVIIMTITTMMSLMMSVIRMMTMTLMKVNCSIKRTLYV